MPYDDYYEYDEPTCRLVGRRSGRVFALGDAVKVEVQSVSVVRRKVDFALAGHRARHHDSHGDRFGRRDKHGRRDKRGRHEKDGRQDGRKEKRRANIPAGGGKQGHDRSGGNRRRGKPKKKR